jgi:hypothetical protein
VLELLVDNMERAPTICPTEGCAPGRAGASILRLRSRTSTHADARSSSLRRLWVASRAPAVISQSRPPCATCPLTLPRLVIWNQDIGMSRHTDISADFGAMGLLLRLPSPGGALVARTPMSGCGNTSQGPPA